MQSCSCVCTEWKDLIYDCRKLNLAITGLDSCQRVKPRFSFGSKGGDKVGQLNYPTAICFAPERNEIIVCDYYNNRIQVFDPRGKIVDIFEIPDKYTKIWPKDICICGPYVLVCNNASQGILVFNQQFYEYLYSIHMSGFHPVCICAFDSESFLVCGKEAIALISIKGTIINTFCYTEKLGQSKLSVTGICVNSFREIILVDGLTDTIYTLGENVQLIDCFKYSRARFGGSSEGRVCVDTDDNIIVTDWFNQRLVIFTPNGNLVSWIDIEARPTALCVYGDRLVVTTNLDSIDVFSN